MADTASASSPSTARPTRARTSKKKNATSSQPSVPPSSSSSSSPPPGFTPSDQKRESSKAASSSLAARRRAHDLAQAALGAGDPEERQYLLQEALNREVEAESFGKVAKWIQSGAFQGFAYGSLPGITLGALTGTLVGGVVSLVTGGIGAGIGALVGPRWKLGDLAGKGIRKITGDWPGWQSTEEQKEILRRMVLDVKGTEMPSDQALEEMSAWDEDGTGTQSWGEYASSFVPGFGKGKNEQKERERAEGQKDKAAMALKERVAAAETPSASAEPEKRPTRSTRTQRTLANRDSASSNAPRKKPRKLEVRSS